MSMIIVLKNTKKGITKIGKVSKNNNVIFFNNKKRKNFFILGKIIQLKNKYYLLAEHKYLEDNYIKKFWSIKKIPELFIKKYIEKDKIKLHKTFWLLNFLNKPNIFYKYFIFVNWKVLLPLKFYHINDSNKTNDLILLKI